MLITAGGAPREDAPTVTATGNTTHIAKEVGWCDTDCYFWGYVHAGDTLTRASCDTAAGSYPDERLCWHTSSGSLSGGYRCGETTGLNSSTTFERVVFHLP